MLQNEILSLVSTFIPCHASLSIFIHTVVLFSPRLCNNTDECLNLNNKDIEVLYLSWLFLVCKNVRM